MENTTMTAKITDGKMTFMVNGKTIVTDNYMYSDYRSHINHWQCVCPDNWICLNGVDEEGKRYTIWYKDIEDAVIADWKHPNDIEDEYGDCVWSGEDLLRRSKQC